MRNKEEIGLVNREINDLGNGKVMVIGKVWRIRKEIVWVIEMVMIWGMEKEIV